MSDLSSLGIGRLRFPERPQVVAEQVLPQYALRRILNFTRRTIDDVVNNPIAKREVLGYYKLHRQIERVYESRELENQWNAVGAWR